MNSNRIADVPKENKASSSNRKLCIILTIALLIVLSTALVVGLIFGLKSSKDDCENISSNGLSVEEAEICTSNICSYDFVLRHHKTMTFVTKVPGAVRPTAYDVILNGSNLTIAANLYRPANRSGVIDPNVGKTVSSDDVITADGYPRYIVTINDQFPGPTIKVTQGAKIVVKVTNQLHHQAATIHWHGITQQNTPFMDGVAYLTQCPILPRQSFTYRFIANHQGTFWYHAHSGQLSDGLLGMIIVHAAMEAPPPISNFPMIVQDWFHLDATTRSVDDPFFDHNPGPGQGFTVSPSYFTDDGNLLTVDLYESGLINGKGRWNDNLSPLSVFTVKKGQQYRFRTVNAASQHVLRIDIDNHELKIIALDGYDVSPIWVDSFIVTPGERVDFIINASQAVNSYWIRASPVAINVPLPQIKAILRYEGSNDSEPTTSSTNCSTKLDGCYVFNCLFRGFSQHKRTNCVGINSVVSDTSNDQVVDFFNTNGLSQTTPDEEIFLNLSLFLSPSINGISNTESRSTLYGQTSTVDNPYVDRCNRSVCEAKVCSCTNIISLAYNQVVQLVITNYVTHGSNISNMPHPFHLHGHSFAVVAMGYQNIDKLTGLAVSPNSDVQCADNLCLTTKWAGHGPPLNLVNPPIKDTVLVPAHGYVVLRFKATNPGIWFAHCHLENHMMHGMSIIFNEAETLQPKVPQNFPTCGDFQASC